VADRPLRPAIHLSHGRPLPHHLANGPRAHLLTRAEALFSHFNLMMAWAYPALASVSRGYSRSGGRLLTCYSPVRRSTSLRRDVRARLACVKHAASVRSEPGSNSPLHFIYSDSKAETFETERTKQDELTHLTLKRFRRIPSDVRRRSEEPLLLTVKVFNLLTLTISHR
jgi:hypothetical protein